MWKVISLNMASLVTSITIHRNAPLDEFEMKRDDCFNSILLYLYHISLFYTTLISFYSKETKQGVWLRHFKIKIKVQGVLKICN